MVDEANKSPAPTPPANRLEKLGRSNMRRKPEGGPKELTARHKLLINYMIDGCRHESICKRVMVERSTMVDGLPAVVTRHPRPGEALKLIEAADLLGIRRRNARELMTLPIFKAAYDDELNRFREGERAASLHTLVAVRDDLGAGKAADRKVRLQASVALMGEASNGGSSVTINNTLSAGQVLMPGIVIDLRDDDDIVAERQAAVTIDHEE